MSNDDIIKPVEGTPEDCRRTASDLAGDTNREYLPVRVFKQGPRTMISGVLPIRVLLRVLAYNSAIKGSTAKNAYESTNRPVDSKHVKRIAEYILTSIKENKPYILPPMTLNAKKGLEVYVPKGRTGPVTGWAVLPEDQQLYITDGQHRFRALSKVDEEIRGTDEGNDFLSNGIPVMVTVSSDLEQIHQDFADAAKTKQLPPSLLAVYDSRHPGNKAVLRLIDNVKLFKYRIDATSTTLSINSPYIFLSNQVRQFVKSSLTNNPAISDENFINQAQASLADQKAFEEWIKSRIIYLEVLTELIPEWKEIADLPQPQGPEGHVVYNKMKEIRSRQPVSLSAAALNALGLVSCKVLSLLMEKGKAPDYEAVMRLMAPVSNIDWSRQSEFWKDNIVQEGLIKTQRSSVRQAAKAILAVIGIPTD